MRNKILLIILSVITLNTSFLYAQNQTDIHNLVPGRMYKIVLFDDTEIFGKVILADSVNITVEMKNRARIIIPKNNILYYSTDLTPSKYNYSLFLLGGVSLFTQDNDYNTYGNGTTVGPNFNLGFIYYLSSTKALKIDAGYTYYKAKYDVNYYYPDPYYQTTYSGGNASLYSVKGSIMFGRYEPSERIILSASLGLGFHYSAQQRVTQSYWTRYYPDTTWKQASYVTPARNDLNAIISVGGSVGYRFSKNFGVIAEGEFDLVTGRYAFIFFGNRNYFPLRAGIFYIL
jgi:hypothetical protein